MKSAVSPISLRILGTGQYVPSRKMESAEFDARWDKPAGWTRRHVGIDHRHYATADEPSSLMGARAAEMALERAGLRADDLDCVVSACSVMEQAIPCSAVLMHRRLGLEGSGIPAYDINATCLSFVTALDLMASAIAVGRYRHVLIVSSEVASAGLNWDDADTAPLFGDGAAAVVLGPGTPQDGSQFFAAHMETYSEGAEFCRVRGAGTRMRIGDGVEAYTEASRFEMSGRATYRLAAQHLPGYMDRLLGRAGIGLGDLKKLVPHQASAKALFHLEAALGFPAQMMIRILETHGNQMAASIPTALHQAIERREIVRGDLIALVGSGAGLSFGGAVLRY